jgi:uncharacterized protein YjeT (DUF2065 family)
MTIKTFFMILAVLAVVHGIGFVLVPDQVASAYGVATSASSRLMAQLFGGALLAWGAIVWFARDFSGDAVRGVLIGTVIGNVVSLIVAAMGTLAGTMNSMGWVAVAIYLFSAAGCTYFLAVKSGRLAPL